MDGRPLTSGEIGLVRGMFGDAIDCSRVRLFKRKWWPFHPHNAAMAPMGDVYFHPKGHVWSEDFSTESLGRQAFFIHELTHVWQAQAKGRFYLLLMRHPFCRYEFHLEPGKSFDRYGLEQQAEIVRNCFLAEHGVPVQVRPPRELLPFAPIVR